MCEFVELLSCNNNEDASSSATFYESISPNKNPSRCGWKYLKKPWFARLCSQHGGVWALSKVKKNPK